MNEQKTIETKKEKATLENSVCGFIFEVIEKFALSVFVVLLVFIFIARPCIVDGRSMENTLYDKQSLLITSLGEIEQGDVIVFHLSRENSGTEKYLIKRVIGISGQTVVIDYDACTITVDGVLYKDENATLKSNATDEITGKYSMKGVSTFQIPEGCYFVLGDNRNNSNDSRLGVGYVDERTVLGKVVLRFSPFTVFQ